MEYRPLEGNFFTNLERRILIVVHFRVRCGHFALQLYCYRRQPAHFPSHDGECRPMEARIHSCPIQLCPLQGLGGERVAAGCHSICAREWTGQKPHLSSYLRSRDSQAHHHL